MAEVTAGQEESFDSLLRRFNKKVQQDGILSELRRHEFYEKPSVQRKRKAAAKRRGTAKSTRARVTRK
ncbi:MAG: 30S ribosomal protein S21 [Dehalococcoidales bacterium]|nr:30S ribosomal protein S21 [Dehalococcoidales bacterium]